MPKLKSKGQPVVLHASFFRLLQPLSCSSDPACSAASLFRLLQPLRLHLVSGLFNRFIIPASSAAQFAPRIRLVQPLHYPGFLSRSACISCPAGSAASSRLLQPLRLHLVSGLFSRFIPASSTALFASRIRLVQPLPSGFFNRSVCISYPACSAALSRLLQPLRLHLVSGLFSRLISAFSTALFASCIRLVQPLHSGFCSCTVCNSNPPISIAASSIHSTPFCLLFFAFACFCLLLFDFLCFY